MKTHNPAQSPGRNTARPSARPLVLIALFTLILVLAAVVVSRFGAQPAPDSNQMPAVVSSSDAPQAAPSGSPSSGYATDNRPAMPERQPGEALETGADAVRNAVRAHPVLLLSLIDFEPTEEKTGPVLGYPLLPVTDAAFLESLGLKPGDLVSTINGVPLEDSDRVQETLSNMSDSNGLTLTLWRDGIWQVLTY